MAEVGSGRTDYADAHRIAAHVSLILGVAAFLEHYFLPAAKPRRSMDDKSPPRTYV